MTIELIIKKIHRLVLKTKNAVERLLDVKRRVAQNIVSKHTPPNPTEDSGRCFCI